MLVEEIGELLGRGVTRNDGDRTDTVGECGRTGERIRAAAGPADDREALDPEVRGELGDVGRAVRDPTAGEDVGAAVAGAIEADEPDPGPLRGRDVRAEQPGAGHAVEEEHGGALGCAPLRPGERPAIGQAGRSVHVRNGRDVGARCRTIGGFARGPSARSDLID